MPKISQGESGSCLCAPLRSPHPPFVSIHSPDAQTRRCQDDPEAKGCFLTLLGPWWAAGWGRRIAEAERRRGWTGVPEPAHRHIRPRGPGGVARAQHAALTPSPASTCSASLSKCFTSSSGGFVGRRQLRAAEPRPGSCPRLVLPPFGTRRFLFSLSLSFLICYRRGGWCTEVFKFKSPPPTSGAGEFLSWKKGIPGHRSP